MFELKACIVCFSASSLVDIDSGNLRRSFCAVAGFQIDSCLMKPHYLCVECSHLVKLSYQFHEKCYQASLKLKELMITKILPGNTKQKTNKTQHLIYIKYNNSKDLESEVKLEPPSTPPDAGPASAHWGDTTKEEQNADIDPHCEDTAPQAYNVIDYQTKQITNDREDEPKLKFEPNVVTPTQSLSCRVNKVVDPLDLLKYGLEDYLISKPPDSDGPKEAIGDWGDMAEEHIGDKILTFESGDKAPQAVNGAYQGADNQADVDLQTITVSCKVCSKVFQVKEDLNIPRNKKMIGKKKKKMVGDDVVCQECLRLKTKRLTYKKYCRKQNNIHRKSTSTPKNSSRPKDPKDFLKYSLVAPEEQYRLIQERQFKQFRSKLKCPICYKPSKGSSTLTSHMKKHDPKISGNFQCDVCKEYASTRFNMSKHMASRHMHKWTCLFEGCSFICHTKSSANAHYNYHKDTTFSCPYCDMNFRKNSTYLSHVRLKHPELNIVCSICGCAFIGERGLNAHKQLSHTKEEIKQLETLVVDPESDRYCTHCQVQLVSDKAYREHVRSSCKIKVELPKNSSGKSARAPRRVAAADGSLHPRPAHTYTSFMCHVCGRIFKNKATMHVHMRTHTGEKPYACPLCDRKFSVPGNRDRHHNTHIGEKPFMCDHCNRSFSEKSSMKCHIQTVHLKIPYEPWVRGARKRRLTHTGEKPFTCHHCNRSFSQKCAMKFHIQTVHLKIPYEPWVKGARKRRLVCMG